MLGEVMEADTDVVPVVAGPSMASSTGNGDSASDKITYNPGELKREEYFLRKIYLRVSHTFTLCCTIIRPNTLL